VLNLQVIAESMADFAPGGSDVLKDNKVETFNFAGLVGAFDTALVANPALTSWSMTNAMLSFHLGSGSDSAAIATTSRDHVTGSGLAKSHPTL
jgi:hypothetical protein